MSRPPLLATLVVAAAVAAMIGLGVWQLQRAEWKERLLDAAEARGDPRPVRIECGIDSAPRVSAGRSRAGETGYRYLVPCGDARGTLLDAGWSKRPDAAPRIVARGRFAAVPEPGNPRLLVLERPLPPLAPSRLPALEDIPNNHLFYAFQWFFFAAAASVIYLLALKRRRREALPPGP